jgi:hypothetical protein
MPKSTSHNILREDWEGRVRCSVTVPTRAAAAAVPTAVAATPPAMAWDPAAESTADTVAVRGRSTALLDHRIIQVSPCGI